MNPYQPKNPFSIEDETTPTQRSALAILGAEQTELDDLQSVLSRALLDEDRATAYGRPLTVEERMAAASDLRELRGVLLSRLLDHPHYEFDFEDFEDPKETLNSVLKTLSLEMRPKLVRFDVIGRLLLLASKERGLVRKRAPWAPLPSALTVAESML